MIYMEPKSLGFEPLKQSWLDQMAPCFTPAMKTTLHELFETYVTGALSMLRRLLAEPLPTVDNCLVGGLMNILDCFFDRFRVSEGDEPPSQDEIDNLTINLESLFVFAMTWSLCITSDSQGH